MKAAAVIASLCLMFTVPAHAGMQAPAVVRADATGHFEYDWEFVVEQSFVIAGYGWSDQGNTSGAVHGDCFCLSFCSAVAGDTLRWHVSGNLVNSNYDGHARNWVAGCEAGGGSSVTLINTDATGVEDPATTGEFRLWSRPNPCRERARFDFNLPTSGRAVLRLYDVAGRRIATLVDDVQAAGSHAVTWEAQAAAVGRGIYFARLEFEGKLRIERILVLY